MKNEYPDARGIGSPTPVGEVVGITCLKGHSAVQVLNTAYSWIPEYEDRGSKKPKVSRHRLIWVPENLWEHIEAALPGFKPQTRGYLITDAESLAVFLIVANTEEELKTVRDHVLPLCYEVEPKPDWLDRAIGILAGRIKDAGLMGQESMACR